MEHIVIFLTFMSTILLRQLSCNCLFNWQLSEDGERCWTSCEDPYQQNSLNVYCQSAYAGGFSGVVYNASANTMSMRKGRPLAPPFNVPHCHNVSLTETQYSLTTSGFIRIDDFYYYRPTSIAADGNVTLCVPPSPQLLQCETVVSHNYYVENGVRVVLPEHDIRAYLGDFVIEENGAVVTCVTNVTASLYKTPRCNYISVRSTDYAVLSNGSIFVPTANFLIKSAAYSLATDEEEGSSIVHLCFPLNFEFLNCSNRRRRMSFPPKAYVFSRDMRVINLALFTTSALDSFYTGMEKELTQCATEAAENSLTLSARIVLVLLSIGFLSSGCLIVTLLTHWSMFVQSDHTLCMLMHIVSMVCSNVTFIAHNYAQLRNEVQSTTLFFWDYYFTVSASLWLNAISYESWRCFKRMRTTAGSSQRKRSWWPFFWYNVYCWSLALFLATLNVAIDVSRNECGATFAICPHIVYFGWFNSVDAFLLYFCVPFNLMTFINFWFFTWMVAIIYKAGEGTEMVNTQRKKQIFIITAKLFILSGFCYVIILVCNVINSIDNSKYMYTWFIESGSFISQGVAIFLIYCSKSHQQNG